MPSSSAAATTLPSWRASAARIASCSIVVERHRPAIAGRRRRRPSRRRSAGSIAVPRAIEHGALDDVIQLAHVARPRVAAQRRQRRLGERRRPGGGGAARAARGTLREPHDVVAALAQRRQMDVDRVEPIQQIAAEAAGLDLGRRCRRSSPRARARRRCCVRDEPSRSNWPSSSTRSSRACCATGMFAISSRNSVPPSASSKRPTRSFFASVNAPFTWPNISLSNTVSARLPMLTVTRLRSRRGERVVNQPRDETLAAAALARDQHVRIRSARRARSSRARAASPATPRSVASPGRLSWRFSASSARVRCNARPSATCVRSTVSKRSLSHGFSMKSCAPRRIAFDGEPDRAPRRHHDDRRVGVERADPRDGVEAFVARRRVARVVQIHEHGVGRALAQRRDERLGVRRTSRRRSLRS